MDDFVNQLSGAISAFDAGWIIGLIAVVNLLTNLTKVPKLKDWIPSAARKWVALDLGLASGLLAALAEGKPLLAAVLQGVIVGVGAIGTHEVTTPITSKLGKVGPAVTSMIFISGLLLMMVSHQGCSSSIGKDAANAANKCAKPAVQEVIISTIPIALAYVDKLTDKDGAVDWDAFAASAKASGWDAAVCLFDEAVKRLLIARTKAGPSPTPRMDNELQKERANDARMRAFPGAQ